MESTQFFKLMSDDTRLMMMLLIHQHKELCVCELTSSLELSQPKVSRHLALLRSSGLLTDRREGKWVFYSLCNKLTTWQQAVLSECLTHEQDVMNTLNTRLDAMGDDRPIRQSACC